MQVLDRSSSPSSSSSSSESEALLGEQGKTNSLVKPVSPTKTISPVKSTSTPKPSQKAHSPPPLPVLPPECEHQPPPVSAVSPFSPNSSASPTQPTPTSGQPTPKNKPPPSKTSSTKAPSSKTSSSKVNTRQQQQQQQQQLTDLGTQLSDKLHQLATIYKAKATKYKAITAYQSLELEKRKIITTTSTMLKSETNYDTIQQIINDSNAVLFPMSLKQHYLKLHIAQIVEQEKELDVIRASLGELHHQFVGIESLLYKGNSYEK
ncbi:hypothetical protein FOB58_004700 [Candida parapsilosis]|uniref:Uncharacterized protein n=2 Tax=Candida parapsilosis TaxID=5480 RepID=G8BH82_CANPC|nr:uncharacterized protein CPAR2_500320 [Candida parapsilosis]KAF6044415.1 hypothetical protein FOB58_004700 [Candida parapsilosis]KAF6045200.1 hypothetical protein FOB59_004676 [Candida parapsilosis]KAF6048655.1 hypothetical protein FOB60_004039 [Candida parapsilosis]KAF6060656.1 hypothetical protein FOB61_004665 [Candida parapsilosis]KAI5901066.1 hypothetical protein K4G60_g191 [Candida parapsilosis]